MYRVLKIFWKISIFLLKKYQLLPKNSYRWLLLFTIPGKTKCKSFIPQSTRDRPKFFYQLDNTLQHFFQKKLEKNQKTYFYLQFSYHYAKHQTLTIFYFYIVDSIPNVST